MPTSTPANPASATSTSSRKPPVRRGTTYRSTKVADMVTMAEQQGLLKGARTVTIRGRMPAQLIAEAKRRTGITSDSALIEAALSQVAVQDNYWQWLSSQRGTIPADFDLEF